MRFRPLLSVLLFAALAAGQQNDASRPKIRLENNVAVPMRDGAVLRADIMRPYGPGKYPVLLYRTPYGKDDAEQEFKIFAKAVARGYAVVIQDVRGRYHSDGEFRPYENEGRDGYDTIEWAARQPWSNGAVGTFGLSYPGAVQWLAAVETPPHLKAMVPAMTFSNPWNFFYAGGTWDMSWIDWIWDNIAWGTRAKKDLPGPRTEKEALDAWKTEGPTMLSTLPLTAVKPLEGAAPYYFDWLRHPPDDPWWKWCDLRDRYGKNPAAVLNLSAWYDDNYGPEGATTNFNGLLQARAGRKDAATHLLLGPWVHGVEETGMTHAGEREFGPAAAIDYDETILRWMDHYLKGAGNGVDREKPVRYFVMGVNQWREADAWPPPAKATPMYLASGEGARSGRLEPEPVRRAESFSEFVSDPANPVVNPYDSSGAHDYRKLAERGDVLTFDSAPVEQDTEVTGRIEERLFVSCDCRDLDLWARLYDVAPEGTAFNLMSPGLDVQRASWRDLRRGRQLLSPGEVYELQLNNPITSNVFLKGHRIRVQIFGSFSPNFSRNLQNGKSEVDSAEMSKAKIRVLHDAAHPSRIVLPVITGAQ